MSLKGLKMIEECEFVQLIGNTVKMRLKEKDGKFRNHYHHYKTKEKALMMYNIFSIAVEGEGGIAM